MSIPRKTGLLFLLLLCGASGARPSASAKAPQTAPPTPQAPAVTPPALPTEQETSPAALEANAARYPPGLLVISVTKDSTAEQAGLKVGDLLLALDGVALRFPLQVNSLYDKARWDNKQAITLTVRREMQQLEVRAVAALLPGFSARPPISEAITKLCVEALTLPAAQQTEVLVKLKAAARAAAQAGDQRAAAWLWLEIYKVVPDGSSEEAEATNNMLHAAAEAGDALLAADSLNKLGSTAHSRGQLEEAQNYFQSALTLQEKLAPDSLSVASSLNNLGVVAKERGQPDKAASYHQRALTLQEKLAPNTLNMAAILNNLGNAAYSRDQLEEAQRYHERALAIKERLAPDSLDVAASLNNLGIVARDRGQQEKAEERHAQAWRIVQAQGRQVAGDSGRQAFGRANGVYAVSLLAAQLANSHAEAAFVTLEQGRAQALLQVMAERSLTEKVAPPAVWQSYQHSLSAHDVAFKDAERSAAQLERARVLLRAQQEQKADAATLLDKQRLVADAEQAFTVKRGEEVRTRAAMESGWGEVRRAAKAAIPEPLDANTARTRLPQGTLVLEFAVGEKSIVLFAATSEGVKAYLLPATREELEAKVTFIRRIVAHDTDARTAMPVVSSRDVESDALRTLYGRLFPAEVQAAIRQARHMVVSPDAFLWDLPFGALVTNTDGAPVYLAQEKPLAYTQSLTLYLQPASASANNLAVANAPVGAKGAAGAKSVPGADVLVIGNPLYDNARRADMLAQAKNKTKAIAAATAKPASATTVATTTVKPPIKAGVKVASARRDGELGTVTADGTAPPQLEHAQEEAEQVASLYHTAAHIGVEPTEAWFRQYAPTARIIHLATHGYLHPYAAQSSGVLLAVPAAPAPAGQYDNDGALQAWEVWSLHLSADLVVLSACETGRGAKVTGEGLIGLTRAWQYAGARTVVSSLWKVSDASTSALMTAFHTHLLAGRDKDEALRLAMCDTAASKQGAWADPHFWAAFVLVGDTGKLRK